MRKLFLVASVILGATVVGLVSGRAGASPPAPVAPTSAHAGSAGGAVAPAVSPQLASNTVFFSNLGPGGSFQSGGWCVSGASTGCTRFDEAMAFVPSVNGRVTRIDIGLTNFSGPNSATVLLAQNNGGVPGNVLGSWPVSGQPSFGSTTCCPTTINLPVTVPIGAGRTYWVIARAGTSTTWDGWNWNYYGTTGTFAYSANGTTWGTTSGTIGAFDVIGCTGACHT